MNSVYDQPYKYIRSQAKSPFSRYNVNTSLLSCEAWLLIMCHLSCVLHLTTLRAANHAGRLLSQCTFTKYTGERKVTWTVPTPGWYLIVILFLRVTPLSTPTVLVAVHDGRCVGLQLNFTSTCRGILLPVSLFMPGIHIRVSRSEACTTKQDLWLST